MEEFMISKIYYKDPENRNYLIQLLGKFLNVNLSKRQNKQVYRMIKKRDSDELIINTISKFSKFNRKKNNDSFSKNKMYSQRRASKISNTLVAFLNIFTKNKLEIFDENTKYLDVGCNTGTITVSLGEKLGIRKENRYGVDVDIFTEQKIVPVEGFTYISYDGYNIPSVDNNFDIITCLMVLHHVDDINKILQEIYRVMKNGGILLVKEHDCHTIYIQWLIYLEHMFYDIIDYDISYNKFIRTYQQYPFSKDELVSVLENNGFKLLGISNHDFLKKYHYYNPTKVFYSIFVKI